MSVVEWSAFVYVNGRLQPITNPYFKDPLYGTFTVCLGRQRVFVCAYHNTPALFVGRNAVTLAQYRTNQTYIGEDSEERREQHYELVLIVNGQRYYVELLEFDGTMLDLKLVEPDGVSWTARCGYQFGVECPETDESCMYTHMPWNEYGVSLPWDEDVVGSSPAGTIVTAPVLDSKIYD